MRSRTLGGAGYMQDFCRRAHLPWRARRQNLRGHQRYPRLVISRSLTGA
jgi:hypothetical protein